MDVQRSSSGNEFHAVVPATDNELSAERLYVRGTTYSPDAKQIAIEQSYFTSVPVIRGLLV